MMDGDRMNTNNRFEQLLWELYQDRSKINRSYLLSYGVKEEPFLPITLEETKKWLSKQASVVMNEDTVYVKSGFKANTIERITLHFPLIPTERRTSIEYLYHYLEEHQIPFLSTIHNQLTNDAFTITLFDALEAEDVINDYMKNCNLLDQMGNPCYPTYHGIGVISEYAPYHYLEFFMDELTDFFHELDHNGEMKSEDSLSKRFCDYATLHENNLAIDNSRVTDPDISSQNPFSKTKEKRMYHILTSSLHSLRKDMEQYKNPLSIYYHDYSLTPISGNKDYKMEYHEGDTEIKIYNQKTKQYLDSNSPDYYEQINVIYNRFYDLDFHVEKEKESYEYLYCLVNKIICEGDKISELEELRQALGKDSFELLLNQQEAGYIALRKMGLSLREVKALATVIKDRGKVDRNPLVKETKKIEIEPAPKTYQGEELKAKLMEKLSIYPYLELKDKQVLDRHQYMEQASNNLKNSTILDIEHYLQDTIERHIEKQEYLEILLMNRSDYLMLVNHIIITKQDYIALLCAQKADSNFNRVIQTTIQKDMNLEEYLDYLLPSEYQYIKLANKRIVSRIEYIKELALVKKENPRVSFEEVILLPIQESSTLEEYLNYLVPDRCILKNKVEIPRNVLIAQLLKETRAKNEKVDLPSVLQSLLVEPKKYPPIEWTRKKEK